MIRRLPTKQEFQTERARRSLREYVRQAWHVAEPATPFVGGWHLDAIAEYLEAVTRGEIRQLLINVPPRSTKSLQVAVFWPTWEWATHPETRWLFASYALGLAIRDSLKCRRLIESPWYQERWGSVFRLTGDQNVKSRYDNTRSGFRLSSSVDSGITGEGGDRLVCFPAEEVVWTEQGRLPIGEIVESQCPSSVWSMDTTTGAVSLKPIEGWHKNPGRRLVRIVLDDGSTIRCTPDHRIWTRNRGWVRADHLSGFDVLPGFAIPNAGNGPLVNAEPLSLLAVGETGGADATNVVSSEFASGDLLPSLPVVRFPGVDGDGVPCLAASDLLDGRGLDSVSRAEDGRRLGTYRDLHGLSLREDGAGAAFVDWESPVLFGVRDVPGATAVGDVLDPAVHGIPVEVSGVMIPVLGANECPCDNLMNEQCTSPPVLANIEVLVTRPAVRSLHDPARDRKRPAPSHGCSRVTHDPADTGHAIEPFIAGDRSPRFVLADGHIDTSYCLTVADNHTFIVGAGQGFIVSNCDDPHNVREAESEPTRESTLEWWDQVMSTRLNDPKTGSRVIVMQRVHEADLAGHVLEKGGWEHLCLPMEYEPKRQCVVHRKVGEETIEEHPDPRTIEGELLCTERFGPAEIVGYKTDLGSRGYAGQMQQRPSPAEGGILKVAWFHRAALSPDKPTAVYQFWDTAFCKTKMSDYSACGTFYEYKDRWRMVDLFYGKLEFPELKREARRLFELYHPRAVIIESKATGIVLLQEWRREARSLPILGYNPDRDGDKVARAYAITPLLEAGKLEIPTDAPWIEPFLHQCTTFPNGQNDDFVDVLTSAIINLGVRKAARQPLQTMEFKVSV